MPHFMRNPDARNLLLTAAISAGTGRHDGDWEVVWYGDGSKLPEWLVTTSLSEAAEQATTAALAHFVEGLLDFEAELQFAIYPWDYGKTAPIYDVTAEDHQYRAHDIVAQSPDIAAPTLEELVEQMALQPRGSEAMLRWIRRFEDLLATADPSIDTLLGLTSSDGNPGQPGLTAERTARRGRTLRLWPSRRSSH
jgi:hypothetical protein